MKIPEYTNSEVEALIADKIHSQRDRDILRRRLIDGVCYEPLAEEFDISVSQVKRVVYNGLSKIFR